MYGVQKLSFVVYSRGLFGTSNKPIPSQSMFSGVKNELIPSSDPADAYGLERITMFSNKPGMSTRN
jgi:hypothetical protein